MNSKQRVLVALDSKQPDKVPIFELYMNESSIVRLAKLLRPEAVELRSQKDRFGEESYGILDLYCLIVEQLQLDTTSMNFSIDMKIINDSYCQDKYGTIYSLSEHGEPVPVKGPINSLQDLKGFDMASKLQPEDFTRIQYVINKVGNNKAHFVCVTDPFKVSWRRRGGMDNLLIDYMLNPQLAHGLARIATDFDIAAIDMAIKAGADAIVMPGDLAGEHNLLISPKCYREYIKPYHKEIVDYAHKRGMKIVKHSDGNLWPILDDFIEVGFDGIHPIQPQSMDIVEVKKHLSGKACILGNIDCRYLLPYGSTQEVENAVKETIEKVAAGGGYIISSSNSIHPGCKPENYITMVEAAHKYGLYDDQINYQS